MSEVHIWQIGWRLAYCVGLLAGWTEVMIGVRCDGADEADEAFPAEYVSYMRRDVTSTNEANP